MVLYWDCESSHRVAKREIKKRFLKLVLIYFMYFWNRVPVYSIHAMAILELKLGLGLKCKCWHAHFQCLPSKLHFHGRALNMCKRWHAHFQCLPSKPHFHGRALNMCECWHGRALNVCKRWHAHFQCPAIQASLSWQGTERVQALACTLSVPAI